jgi:hypothetical protein
MATTSNNLENLVEQQKSLVNAMTEASKELQENMMKGFSFNEESPQLLADYMNKQKDWAQKVFSNGYSMESMQKFPEYTQEWFTMVSEFGKKFLDTYQQYFAPEKIMSDYQKSMEGVTKQFEALSKQSTQFFNDQMSNPGKLTEMGSLEDLPKMYSYLHESINYATELMKTGITPMESMSKYMASDSMKKIMDSFTIPQMQDSMKPFQKQMQNMMNDTSSKMQESSTKSYEMIDQMVEPVQKALKTNWEQSVANVHSTLQQMEKASEPMQKMVPEQQQKLVQEMYATQKDLTAFMLKAVELQGMFTDSMTDKLRKANQEFVLDYQKMKEAPAMDELSKSYIDKMEKTVDKIFKDSSFKKTQDEVSNIGARISNSMKKVMDEAGTTTGAATTKSAPKKTTTKKTESASK